jgi:hypothetical protein
MRSPSHPPLRRRRAKTSLLPQLWHECVAARVLLGDAHPLVVVLQRSCNAFEQVLAVGAVELVAWLLIYRSAPLGPSLATAAGLVLVALGLRIMILRQSARDISVQMIAAGSGPLPLAASEREWRRLEDPRHREQLAHALEEIADTAVRRSRCHPSSRPLYDVRVVRMVEPQLREIAELLRDGVEAPRGVAVVERLITSGLSPLYGADVEPLRDEVRQARDLLMLSPTGVAPEPHRHAEDAANRRRGWACRRSRGGFGVQAIR